MALLELKGIVKQFGQSVVLGGVDLAVREGELTVLIGPSGCGKTTLLRIIAGLLQPDGGSILLDRQDVTSVSPGKRNVAMVFQDQAIYPHLTVRENLSFGLEIRKAPPNYIRQVTEGIATTLELLEDLHKYPFELSGGQRQRVALGRAIARKPAVFLLDEPLSSLDAPLRGRARAVIRDLHQKLRATMLYVTHDQEEAMALGDRVAVLYDGRVLQHATPEEVYDCPLNRTVAGFMGTPPMQFFSGRLETDEGKVRFFSPELTTMIGSRFGSAGQRQVVLGVRPENLMLSSPASGLANGSIGSVEMLGGEYLAHVDLETGGRLLVRARRNQPLIRGQQVGVLMPEEGIHLFDLGSGDRIGTKE